MNPFLLIRCIVSRRAVLIDCIPPRSWLLRSFSFYPFPLPLSIKKTISIWFLVYVCVLFFCVSKEKFYLISPLAPIASAQLWLPYVGGRCTKKNVRLFTCYFCCCCCCPREELKLTEKRLNTISYIPIYGLRMPIYRSNLTQYGRIREKYSVVFFTLCECLILENNISYPAGKIAKNTHGGLYFLQDDIVFWVSIKQKYAPPVCVFLPILPAR